VTAVIPAGGKYGTALQAASYQGELEAVGLLLERVRNRTFKVRTFFDPDDIC
jgi:hypothetical protein